MYLIHARLHVPSGHPLPIGTGSLVLASGDSDDGVEHVTVHHREPHWPVLGLFVLAVDLEQAELAAERVCRRALESLPALRGGSLLGCGAGFVRAFFEADLAVPGAAGRKGTGPLQDSPAL